MRVTAGLLQDLSQDSTAPVDWILDGAELQLTTFSVFPSAQASVVTGGATGDQTTAVSGTWSTAWGVGPVGLEDGQLQAAHTVALYRLEGGQPDHTHAVTDNVSVAPVIGNVPRALWSTAAALAPTVAALNSQAPTIPEILTGVVIDPIAVPPDQTPVPVSTSVLQDTLDPTIRSFAWSAQTPPTEHYDQTDAMAQFSSSLVGTDPAALRAGILAALVAQGASVTTSVDVDRLAALAADTLDDPPVLAELGS